MTGQKTVTFYVDLKLYLFCIKVKLKHRYFHLQCAIMLSNKEKIGFHPMLKTNFLKNLASQLSEALPSHIGALKKDFEKNCHGILTNAFAKFDLVTREEFDTQNKVLSRTRKKLEELEAEIKELEKLLQDKHQQ